MVYLPGEFKGMGRGHAGNDLTEQDDDLLVSMTIAVEDDYFSLKIIPRADIRRFLDNRDIDRFDGLDVHGRAIVTMGHVPHKVMRLMALRSFETPIDPQA